jgi:hypothetical protein
MIHYFRINDPYRLIGLFLLLTVLFTPQIIDLPPLTIVELKSFIVGEKAREGFLPYSELIDHLPPLASWYYGFCDWLFGRSLIGRHVAAFFILFLQGAHIGLIFIEKRAFTENTYIPSFVFSVLILVSYDVISLTADLIAFGFLLLALGNLFKQIEFREQRDETILNLGLFISFASLFTFSYVIFFPGITLMLLIFTRNNLRQYLLLFFGFMLPHVLLFAIYAVYDHHPDLLERFYKANLLAGRSSLLSVKSLLILCAVPLFYLLLSLFVLTRNARLSKYQSQLLQAMSLWLALALIHAWLSPDLRTQTLLPAAPAVSFLFTHFFLLIRQKKYMEFNAWLIVLGVTATAYLARYEVIPVEWGKLPAPKTSLLFSGKRILVLEDAPGSLVNNRLSPPFIDWNLSRSVFEKPDEYGSVLLVNRLFQRDPPEIIVDPDNRMQKFFFRLPELERTYKKADGTHWIKISN